MGIEYSLPLVYTCKLGPEEKDQPSLVMARTRSNWNSHPVQAGM